MSVPAVQQVISALEIIRGADGTTRGRDKLDGLKANRNYFRWHLLRLGFAVLGDWDSPVMPIMLYMPAALVAVGRMCLAQHVALVVVRFAFC